MKLLQNAEFKFVISAIKEMEEIHIIFFLLKFDEVKKKRRKVYTWFFYSKETIKYIQTNGIKIFTVINFAEEIYNLFFKIFIRYILFSLDINLDFTI